jgi:hypothetical protein
MNDLTPLVLIGLICLAVGFALGALVGSLRSSKGEQHRESFRSSSQPPIPPAFSQVSTVPARGSMNLEAAQPAQPGPEKPGLNPIKTITQAIQIPGAPRIEEPLSIAGQIDAILQEKLAQSPGTPSVRLVEVPGRGVIVRVGLEAYDGVDQVPDPGIRQLIRAAVAEWEQSGGQS